jgi:hypothetical protein
MSRRVSIAVLTLISTVLDRRRRNRRPRAQDVTGTKLPLVLSSTALAVAVLGTTPLAAIAQNAVFPRNSVGSVQLKRGAVTAAKIAPDAVRSAHVQDGSLLAKDFKPGQLPQGPKGDKGDQGVPGAQGATNVVVRRSSPPPGAFGHAFAHCNPGERAVGGGVGIPEDGASDALTVRDSKPFPLTGTPTGWQAAVSSTVFSRSWAVYVICSSP